MQPDFREAAESIGCRIGPITEDDRIHRCATDLHPKKRNGSYRTDGVMGWAKNWETGETVTWHEARTERSPHGGPIFQKPMGGRDLWASQRWKTRSSRPRLLRS